MYIRHTIKIFFISLLILMMWNNITYTQNKKFELSIGGQRMMNFNMGNLVGYIDDVNIIKDEFLAKYNYDISLSMIISPKNTITLGAGPLTVGRSSSSLGGGWSDGPLDLPCFYVQYTSLNIYGMYSRDLWHFATWNVVASAGLQYWRNTYLDNIIDIHANTMAGWVKLGMRQEVVKNFNLHFNTMWIQSMSNIFSGEGQSTYIPSILGLELRLGWMF